MTTNKKLSKRAQKLLAEIESANVTNDINIESEEKNQVIDERIEYYPGSTQKFLASKYRKSIVFDKKPLWSFNFLILVGILLFVTNLAWGFYQDYNTKISKTKRNLPKILAEIKNIEKNAQQIQQEVFAKKQHIQSELEKIPNQDMADEIVNEVAELLENSELRIVKQEIQINKSISPVSFGMPPIQKPAADATIFSNIVVPIAEDNKPKVAKKEKSKAKDKKTKKKAKSKKVDKKEDTAQIKDQILNNFNQIFESVKKKETERKQNLIKDLPENVAFMNYHFQLKGQYLDYLKVRQYLIKRYPFLIIPVEEIVTENNDQDIQFRVIYDIPFFTENISTNVNTKGS